MKDALTTLAIPHAVTIVDRVDPGPSAFVRQCAEKAHAAFTPELQERITAARRARENTYPGKVTATP